MKLEEYQSKVKQVDVSGEGIMASVTNWANHEGCNIIVTDDKTLAVRMAGCFRWEELKVIMVAMQAAA